MAKFEVISFLKRIDVASMEADKAESKTKLLKTLAKEVNGIKKDVDEQKVKIDNIAEWIKNTFRPGMEKMKGI